MHCGDWERTATLGSLGLLWWAVWRPAEAAKLCPLGASGSPVAWVKKSRVVARWV